MKGSHIALTDLSFATLFTGAVILIWGWRSLRNRKVNALFFKLRGRHSTWIFGFVSVIAGLLMLLSGLPQFQRAERRKRGEFCQIRALCLRHRLGLGADYGSDRSYHLAIGFAFRARRFASQMDAAPGHAQTQSRLRGLI